MKTQNLYEKICVFLSEVCPIVKEQISTIVEKPERNSHFREFGMKLTGNA